MTKELESIEIAIQKFSTKGYGVGHLPSGKVIEIAHAVPGDLLRVSWRKSRGVQKGRLQDVIEPSKDRVTPLCKHATICGGCSWQQMDYSAQLKEKQRRVEALFEGFSVDPILPCEMPFGYRNKMEFTFSQNRAGERYLGLMIAQNSFVYNLFECHLGSSWFAKAVLSIRSWWEKSSLQAYYPPKDTGLLRHLTLREAFRTGQKMAILHISGRPEFAPTKEDLEGFVSAICAVDPQISVFLKIHQAIKGRPTQFYEMHLHGADYIEEILHLQGKELRFKISPASFFQTNTLQAERLYATALQMLPKGVKVVYDLYSGTGTLALAASLFVEEVIGIELVKEAVLDAEENLKRNQISNCRFYQGDVAVVLKELMENPKTPRPDAVLVDPPRAGLGTAVEHLKNLLPQAIIYISCNPQTQAADIGQLLQAGYQIKRLQPVDQFPHTYHIENIALLER